MVTTQIGKKGIFLPKDMDKCKSGFLRLSFARNLENHLQYVPLWDRMEGAWLWTLFTFCQVRLLVVTSRHSLLWPHTVCCVLTEQELSEILLINRQCSNIMQYLNRESWEKYIYLKGFDKCVREETFHLATLNLKVHKMLKKLKQNGRKVQLGPGNQTAKTWFGLEK